MTASPPIDEVSYGLRLTQIAAERPDDVDLIVVDRDGHEREVTWRELETRANQIARALEAHGVAADAVLRPTWQGQSGWPVLVPGVHLAALSAVGPDLMPPDAIEALVSTVASRALDLGDPGVVHDVDTPRADLPPYEGPPEPPAGHRHDWGEDVEAEAGLGRPGETV